MKQVMAIAQAAAGALFFAVCSLEAYGQDVQVDQDVPLDQGDCLSLNTEAEIVDCMRQVSEASQARLAEADAEIAALDQELAQADAENAALEQELAEIRAQNEVLRIVRDVSREAAKAESGTE